MDQSKTSKPDIPGLVIAAGLLVLAAIIINDAFGLWITSNYGVGPKAMPFVIAIGLVLLAIGNAIVAWQGGLPERDPYDRRAVLLILGGLAALMAVIGLGGGFIIATTILFTATSTAFGRRAFIADAALGLVIAIVIYLVFDKVLTLSLPAGPLERLI